MTDSRQPKPPEVRINDAFASNTDGIYKETNHSGGVLGGMSDGSTIILRTTIKPTPSISQPQDTVDKDGNPLSLTIRSPRSGHCTTRRSCRRIHDSHYAEYALSRICHARMDKIAEFIIRIDNSEDVYRTLTKVLYTVLFIMHIHWYILYFYNWKHPPPTNSFFNSESASALFTANSTK